MKLSKKEGCLKLAMKRASFKNHFAGDKNKPGTASRSPQLKVLPSLRFISHLTGAPSRNDVSSQVPWIPSHGGLRRLNAEQVFGIQAICESLGLSINKQTNEQDITILYMETFNTGVGNQDSGLCLHVCPTS